jgi:hypothetical protein
MMNVAEMTASVDAIEVVDPRARALRDILPAIKAKLAAGATKRQIVAALTPHFNEASAGWLDRELSTLLRKRGGGRKKKAVDKPPARPRLAAAAE